MMLAGLLDAPSGSECATSSINSTDGPPRLVLRLDNRLGPCLAPVSFDVPSPLLQLSLFPSESDTTAPSPPCVELELSLRKRPMIDFGCFGFSMPPNVGKVMTMEVFVQWDGWEEKRKIRVRQSYKSFILAKVNSKGCNISH